MKPDFNLGRSYERQEVCVQLASLLQTEDDELLRTNLKLWLNELADSLPAKVYEIITEDLYIVL